MRAQASKSLFFIVVLAAAGLACNAVTSLGGSGGSSAEAALLKDDFSNSGSGWGTGTDSDSSVEYVDGGLHMQIFKDNFFTWSNPGQESYENVHMEVTARNPSAATRVAFGLMCDQQSTDSSYYYFAVSPDGQYVIGKSEVAKQDVFLTNNDDWASSELIAKEAASYRIGADCGPSALTLYVDGKKVDSVTDASYAKGGVGLFLWSGDEPTGEVTYDDFVMNRLK